MYVIIIYTFSVYMKVVNMYLFPLGHFRGTTWLISIIYDLVYRVGVYRTIVHCNGRNLYIL